MKKLLTFGFCLFYSIGFSQLVVQNGKLKIERVFELEGMSADQIFNKSKMYIGESLTKYYEASEVYPELIVNKFVAKYQTGSTKEEYEGTIKIHVKEGKMKMEILNIEMVANKYSLEASCLKKDGSFKEACSSTIKDIEAQSKIIFDEAESYLKKSNAW